MKPIQNINSHAMTTRSCPIDTILGVWKFERPPQRHARATSTPGHLLHFLVEGEYELRTNGRDYHVTQNDVIYYYESEEVEWLWNPTPVTFISVGFLGHEFSPLPIQKRVFQASSDLKQAFNNLYGHSLLKEGFAKDCAVFSALLHILTLIENLDLRQSQDSGTRELWHDLESELRKRKAFRPTHDDLERWSGFSKATIVRSCRKATGKSPMRQIRHWRMNEALGLILYSSLTITQIAEYLRYPRLHEFTREFSAFHGFPPTRLRKERGTPP